VRWKHTVFIPFPALQLLGGCTLLADCPIIITLNPHKHSNLQAGNTLCCRSATMLPRPVGVGGCAHFYCRPRNCWTTSLLVAQMLCLVCAAACVPNSAAACVSRLLLVSDCQHSDAWPVQEGDTLHFCARRKRRCQMRMSGGESQLSPVKFSKGLQLTLDRLGCPKWKELGTLRTFLMKKVTCACMCVCVHHLPVHLCAQVKEAAQAPEPPPMAPEAAMEKETMPQPGARCRQSSAHCLTSIVTTMAHLISRWLADPPSPQLSPQWPISFHGDSLTLPQSFVTAVAHLIRMVPLHHLAWWQPGQGGLCTGPSHSGSLARAACALAAHAIGVRVGPPLAAHMQWQHGRDCRDFQQYLQYWGQGL